MNCMRRFLIRFFAGISRKKKRKGKRKRESIHSQRVSNHILLRSSPSFDSLVFSSSLSACPSGHLWSESLPIGGSEAVPYFPRATAHPTFDSPNHSFSYSLDLSPFFHFPSFLFGFPEKTDLFRHEVHNLRRRRLFAKSRSYPAFD